MTDWKSDKEVTGSKELKRSILDDSVSFTRFLNPISIQLTTQESRSKKTIKEISVDFVYNIRQFNGLDSCGWEGAGFLNGKLRYTGFTRYDDGEGKICANQYNFLGKKVKNTAELKKAIEKYYGKNFQEFIQALNSLPEDMGDITKKILL